MKDQAILLGVNIDHVATLRQARGTVYPSPVHAAFLVEQAGADSITIHLREDRRHIQDQDLALLSQTVETRINLECALTDEMLTIAISAQPADVCLVPEKREEVTTEGGLGVVENLPAVSHACQRLKDAGIRASLFIDPDPDQIQAAADSGAPVIELHTGCYADANSIAAVDQEYQRIRNAAQLAADLGLQVNAGHGLHYHNVQAIAAIEQVRELNIGHAIVARSVFVGLSAAVSEMKRLMLQAR